MSLSASCSSTSSYSAALPAGVRRLAEAAHRLLGMPLEDLPPDRDQSRRVAAGNCHVDERDLALVRAEGVAQQRDPPR